MNHTGVRSTLEQRHARGKASRRPARHDSIPGRSDRPRSPRRIWPWRVRVRRKKEGRERCCRTAAPAGSAGTRQSQRSSAARSRRHDLARLGVHVLQRPVRRLLHDPRAQHAGLAPTGTFPTEPSSTPTRRSSSPSSFSPRARRCSSACGRRSGATGKKARSWIVTSFLLGAAFLGNQAYEWKTLPFRPQHQRLRLALLHHVRPARSARAARARGDDRPARAAGGPIKGGDPGETAVFQAVSYYWHFVDIVWIGLFSALFLLS